MGATKLLREESGMSLTEAKEFLERAASGNENPAQSPKKAVPISQSVLAELMQAKKIEAIKVLRAETGLGLKDAKEAVEQALLEHPHVRQMYDEISSRNAKSMLWKLAFIIVIAYATYRLFVM